MIVKDHRHLTDVVLAEMQKTPDPRLREIMVALAGHLHQFVRDVKLTEPEFQAALAIINRVGQASNDSHNEAAVMAGSLGVSQLVCLLNNGSMGETETTANLLGPFWRMHVPRVENGGTLLRSPTPGPTLYVRGRFWTAKESPSLAPMWTCGIPRPWVFTSSRIPNRPR